MMELKESLPAEGKSDEEVQTSSPSIKDRIRRLHGITKPNENYQETIHKTVAAAVREDKSQTKLKESTTAPEGMRKETKSQHKKLKDKLEEEKEKVTREERSSVQVPKSLVVTNLKRVEERNTKLEDEVTELNERMLADEKTAKEVEMFSLKIKDRIRRLQGITKSTEADQGTIHKSVSAAVREEIAQSKIKDRIRRIEEITEPNENYQETLHEDNTAAVRKEISQTKLEENTKVPEGVRKETKSQQKKDYLDQETGKTICVGRSRVQVSKTVTNLKKVEERTTKPGDKVTELKESFLVGGKTTKEPQKSSLTLNERIKELEVARTKPESQQMNLNDSLFKLKNRIKKLEVAITQSQQMNVNETSLKQLDERIKKLARTKTQSQQNNMEYSLAKEKDMLPLEHRSPVKIKDSITRKEETTKSIENDQKTTDKGVAAAVSEKILQTKLEENTKVPEGVRKETKSQQKKDYLDQETGKTICVGRSRVQVTKPVTNLKKVEERTTKPGEKVTELKESFLAGGKTTKEPQKSSLTINERIKELEVARTKPESQQMNLNDSSLKLKNKIKELEVAKAKPQSQQMNMNERSLKQLDESINKLTRTKTQIQQNNLEYSLVKEKEMLPLEHRSPVKVKDSITRKEETTKSIENDQETTDKGVAAAVSEEILQTKLEENTKVLEGVRKETKSQQKKDYLDQETDRIISVERSRVQVPKPVTNLKKFEERNTKLEDKVTELKEILLAEGKTTKEPQKSSLTLNERIKELEVARTKPESQQMNLNDSSLKLHERIKELEVARTKTQSRQNNLEYSVVKEKEKLPREHRTQVKIKDSITRKEEITKSIENDQKTTDKGVAAAVSEEILQTKLKESTEIPKGMRKETKSQHKKDQEIRKAICEERSRVQVVRNLKKVEERNKKMENVATQLKERLPTEKDKDKEVQSSFIRLWRFLIFLLLFPFTVVRNLKNMKERNTNLEHEVTQLKESLLIAAKTANIQQKSSLKLNETVKELEGMRMELESQQKKLKDELDRIKWVYASRQLELERENKHLKKVLSTIHMPANKQGMLERRRVGVNAQPRMSSSNPAINDINMSVSVTAEPANSVGMLARYLSDSKVHNRQFPASNAIYELQSDSAESVESGIFSSSSTSTSHFDNTEQLNPDLKVAITVTLKGAHMHIPDTGVELDIPAGAVRHKQLIEVTIIPFDEQFAPIENFSSNSSVVVELLPNEATFSLPVNLKLPHCLKLKKNYKEIKNPVKVFVSHHETGPPVWKEDSSASAKCTLEEDHCVIRLKQFCWVKYEINDKIVVAKRVKVFTAGKTLNANDSIAEIEVGCHMDLPGRAEDLNVILGMAFYQSKPFVFVKEGELPLQLVLSKIIPREWKYITPDENPKIISYKSIADAKDTSCPFALEKSRSTERNPFGIFKIVQGNESVELSIRL